MRRTTSATSAPTARSGAAGCARRPERLALIHFGVAEDVERHLAELRVRLHAWTERVRAGLEEKGFGAAAREDFTPEEAAAYDRAMPFWQSYAGLARWRDKRVEA